MHKSNNPSRKASPAKRSAREQRPTLRELEVLRAIINHGRTTIAAQKLGISQPAISRIITGFEERLGRQLFMRANGRLVPTPEAMTLEAQAAVIFNLVDNLVGLGAADDTDGPIRIAASPSLAHQMLGRILSRFIAQEPGLRVHVEIGRSPDCLAAVADGAADFALVDQSPVHDGVRLEIFRRSRAHVIMPAKHRLAALSKISPADLAGESFVALSRRFSLRTRIDTAFATYHVEPRIVAEGATSTFLVELVRNGTGLTILNPFPLELTDPDELAMRPFEPEIPIETAVAVPASEPLKPAARALVNFIRKEQPTARHSSIVR